MSRQDLGVPEPHVRLRVLLALLRIRAGRRGDAAVRWHGGGFLYELHVVRSPSSVSDVDVDADPGVRDLDEIRARVRDALRVQP